MKARYTPRALADLLEIADYIRQFNPAAALKVRDDIRRAIAMLERFPHSGPRTNVPPVRKAVVRRYPYIIYYEVEVDRREIVILTIQHGAKVQPFEG